MCKNNNRPYAVVIGAVNIDIGGTSYKPLIKGDSNPGRITHSHGGVGRNIAHNLCLLGIDVKFITALGDDIYADKIYEHCSNIGMDLSYSIKVKGEATSTYLFIAGPKGNMELAISDTSISKYITPSFIEERLSILNNASAVVFDTNLSPETIEFIGKNCTSPLFVDPVSVAKALKITPILKCIHTIKPNLIEAELLSKVRVSNSEELYKCGEALYNMGVKNIFITMGERGVFYYGEKGSMLKKSFKSNVVNTTGAGDAFCSALVYSYLNEFSIEDTLNFGQSASALTIEAIATINEDISPKKIKQRMESEDNYE